ncbi:hypothetical protein DSL64_04175 [Dyadobacter luteus]|jgi:multidrug transporter EmrE-like cation transporter|uniref:DoxX family protein n=1 Tax=Dyadobacter luteus TaxID=2259619 RepID=A0A3D8YG76_9BACT|nr:hypothetical protein [Dyadobacter luteus]REA63643.1 hypothetical protein DSL64_04175 [Dyadobacter luteus]
MSNNTAIKLHQPLASNARDDQNAESKTEKNKIWTSRQKLLFRILGTYFVFLCIPSYSNFYTHLWNLEFSKITYHDFQHVVAFWPPQLYLIETEEGVFGFLNYINLILLLGVSVVLGLIWTVFDKRSTNYRRAYYWVSVLVRYRLAFGMVGWGMKKAFPMQMVYPTLGMLNTPFIDMAEKKLYWSHVGVSFGYTVFLGFAEIIPGLLLLHRKTASLGGALAAVVCFNIVLANHAYDAGVAVPAAYFTLLGLFVVASDFGQIYTLLVKEKDVRLSRFYPSYNTSQNRLKLAVKAVGIFIFVPLTAFMWGYGFFNGNNYNIPSTQAAPGLKGYYNVENFALNGKSLPYSPSDSVRWQDAIFEDWSTLSFRTNRTAFVDRMIGYSPLRVKGDKKNTNLNQVNTQDSDQLFKQQQNRDLGVTRWEVGGMAGDRSYFFYHVDTTKQILYLQNKNKNHQDERQVLHYSFHGDRILLKGVNQYRDSVQVVLKKVEKIYPLAEGRQSQVRVF